MTDKICDSEGCNNPRVITKRFTKRRCKKCDSNWFRYKITTPERDQMLADQDGKCAICDINIEFGQPQQLRNRVRAMVDHCHTTNVIRGIICGNCNGAIGMLKDDPDIIRAAANYIERGIK